jgi:hypothetical protein
VLIAQIFSILPYTSLQHVRVQLISKCVPSEQDRMVFAHVCALFSGDAQKQNGVATGEDAALARKHDAALQLVLHVWLQCDGNLDAADAAARRRYTAAQWLYYALQRVAQRDRTTTQGDAACRCEICPA